MDFGTEAGIFLAYAAGLLAIYFFGKLFLLPIKKTVKLLINGLLGAAVLVGVNYVGAFFGFFIPINPLTAFITGVLGVPGIVGLALYFLVVPVA